MRALALSIFVLAAAIAATASTAHASRTHRVQKGETLIHIADAYGCELDQLKQHNRLSTSLIVAGATIKIPACKKPSRVAARAEPANTAQRGKAQARMTKAPKLTPLTPTYDPNAMSVGLPWAGRLAKATRLPEGEGYFVRRPENAFGTTSAVGYIQQAIANTRASLPDLHDLAIGDLSSQHGGRIREHRSHQSGRDIDLGLYFVAPPDGYPRVFADYSQGMDLGATFQLIHELAASRRESDGVEMMFLDYEIQGHLYEDAAMRGVSLEYLEELFQYPRGKRTQALIRHEPNHADHLHVRYKCPVDDARCR